LPAAAPVEARAAVLRKMDGGKLIGGFRRRAPTGGPERVPWSADVRLATLDALDHHDAFDGDGAAVFDRLQVFVGTPR
jgi:hypothetical protein